MSRGDLERLSKDELFEPVLKLQRPAKIGIRSPQCCRRKSHGRVGRPRTTAAFSTACCGCCAPARPWADLPARFGPPGTVSSRFDRWRQAGVFDRVLRRLQARADVCGALDWDLCFVDATVVRAHQHAAGARRIGAIEG